MFLFFGSLLLILLLVFGAILYFKRRKQNQEYSKYPHLYVEDRLDYNKVLIYEHDVEDPSFTAVEPTPTSLMVATDAYYFPKEAKILSVVTVSSVTGVPVKDVMGEYDIVVVPSKYEGHGKIKFRKKEAVAA
ncbi:MAG: hypothetical protein A2431_03105 [Candidatus Zambryskibacteria bacterium RIFOXYC1_FULL_39_10]|uniref:Uncharacterized protein n=1 Tax=Candidatus Zambryskibacteria bacterium RIFOXYC1_FULL_39_10 TaxID=1802779 RepID=A0A1G2V070_9BACT|nr:MAG: hypothetical protein A2605_01965 [Candidatus Zambryskibacteria bacterium RIFOXYD1_FULL_39_35]OHB15010.1 MAG: hypothetical protein A2431_03105 [Candidatus Zambryskibacteria bacterium RIFOXYC1_FULL_39_10]